jgi:hypothetical protein
MVSDVSKELDMDLTRDRAWKKDIRLNRSCGVLEYEQEKQTQKHTVMGTALGPNNCRERRQTAISVIDANIPEIILGAQICRASVNTVQGKG